VIEQCSLSNLVEKPISGEWGEGEGQVQVIRTANFTNHGRINFSTLVGREISEKKVNAKKLAVDDIIIEKSGGSPAQPVGRVVFFEREGTYLCNNFTSILRPLKEKVFPKYLHYILFCNHKFGFVRKYQNKTTGIINLQLTKYLKGTEIPLPPLAEQKKIAAILDAADRLRQKDAQLIAKYNVLSQSLFLAMFGDPVTNPMGWEKVKLKSVTYKIGSGSTPRGGKESYQTEGISLIRSLNVYDHKFKYRNLAFISGEQADKLKNVIVKANDVLFNITGASICRSTVVPAEVLPARVNQHVSILRPIHEKIHSLFLSYLIISDNVKRQLLGVGSGGGAVMEAITKEQLQNYEVIVPEVALQNQFAERIQAIEAQKQQAQASLQKSEDLFNSLLQRAFKGELTT